MDIIIHSIQSVTGPGYGEAAATVLHRVIHFEVINHHFNMKGELNTTNMDISFSEAEEEVRKCLNAI